MDCFNWGRIQFAVLLSFHVYDVYDHLLLLDKNTRIETSTKVGIRCVIGKFWRQKSTIFLSEMIINNKKNKYWTRPAKKNWLSEKVRIGTYVKETKRTKEGWDANALERRQNFLMLHTLRALNMQDHSLVIGSCLLQ